MKINWLGLAFSFFSAASLSNEFDTKLSGSEVCTEIRQAMSAALAKDQHPLSGLETNIDAIESGMLELDDDPIVESADYLNSNFTIHDYVGAGVDNANQIYV